MTATACAVLIFSIQFLHRHEVLITTWFDRSGSGNDTVTNTDWLAGSKVAVDAKGFVLTGSAVGGARQLESSCPGIFAVGDVRAGSVKRVAAAVGDGAHVIAELHDYLSKGNHPKVLNVEARV